MLAIIAIINMIKDHLPRNRNIIWFHQSVDTVVFTQISK